MDVRFGDSIDARNKRFVIADAVDHLYLAHSIVRRCEYCVDRKIQIAGAMEVAVDRA